MTGNVTDLRERQLTSLYDSDDEEDEDEDEVGYSEAHIDFVTDPVKSCYSFPLFYCFPFDQMSLF